VSPLAIGLLVGAVSIVVLASGIPVAFGLGVIAIGFLIAFEGLASLSVLADTFYAGLNDFTLVSIPAAWWSPISAPARCSRR
jgi:C4-dicarboxylate transporter DctM subunit